MTRNEAMALSKVPGRSDPGTSIIVLARVQAPGIVCQTQFSHRGCSFHEPCRKHQWDRSTLTPSKYKLLCVVPLTNLRSYCCKDIRRHANVELKSETLRRIRHHGRTIDELRSVT